MAQLGTKAVGSLLESMVGTWTDRVRSGSRPSSPGSGSLLGQERGRMACVCGGGAFLPPSR